VVNKENKLDVGGKVNARCGYCIDRIWERKEASKMEHKQKQKSLYEKLAESQKCTKLTNFNFIRNQTDVLYWSQIELSFHFLI
jgi:hypothetical protein